MLPLNLLLLPLLGGFIFVSRWHLSRFVILRAEGYRLLFHSASAGLSLLFLSALLASALPNIPLGFVKDIIGFIDASWHRVAPVPYSGIAVFALILGSLLWLPLNYLVLPRSHQIDEVINRKGDALEILMRRAMGKSKPILVCLKSGKAYVGYITTNFNPIFQTEYVQILPLRTGYFKDDVKGVRFTKFYEKHYVSRQKTAETQWKSEHPKFCKQSMESLFKGIEEKVGLKDFELVLPIAEIQSVAIYQESEQ